MARNVHKFVTRRVRFCLDGNSNQRSGQAEQPRLYPQSKIRDLGYAESMTTV